jgi:hypothetical protein
MVHNNQLRLDIAGPGDITAVIFSLCGLALVAAIMSPRPVIMSIVAISVCAAGWGAFILRFSKVEGRVTSLVIYTDGRIGLESGSSDASGGTLEGQQWSTRYFAFLRVVAGGRARLFLVLSFRQRQADDYRLLLMWLQQGICKVSVTNRGNVQHDL